MVYKYYMGFWFRPQALETAWREAELLRGDNLSRASLQRYLVSTTEIWEPLMGIVAWLIHFACSGPSFPSPHSLLLVYAG